MAAINILLLSPRFPLEYLFCVRGLDCKHFSLTVSMMLGSVSSGHWMDIAARKGLCLLVPACCVLILLAPAAQCVRGACVCGDLRWCRPQLGGCRALWSFSPDSGLTITLPTASHLQQHPDPPCTPCPSGLAGCTPEGFPGVDTTFSRLYGCSSTPSPPYTHPSALAHFIKVKFPGSQRKHNERLMAFCPTLHLIKILASQPRKCGNGLMPVEITGLTTHTSSLGRRWFNGRVNWLTEDSVMAQLGDNTLKG